MLEREEFGWDRVRIIWKHWPALSILDNQALSLACLSLSVGRGYCCGVTSFTNMELIYKSAILSLTVYPNMNDHISILVCNWIICICNWWNDEYLAMMMMGQSEGYFAWFKYIWITLFLHLIYCFYIISWHKIVIKGLSTFQLILVLVVW